MFKNTGLYLIPLLAIVLAGSALGATDPTLSQVYEAARSGHVPQAQQMMREVLRDHPASAKAHYVAAELYARQRDIPMARQELETAERLQPGLPFADAASVGALRRELSPRQPGRGLPAYSQAHAWFPWGAIAVVIAALGALWLVLRGRRSPGSVASAYPGQSPGTMPTVVSGPVIPGGPAVAPSIGSGLAGGLASGLALGAGVVAGEEIARHLLDSGAHESSAAPVPNPHPDSPENDDLGGQDFGVQDGGSWDDDPSGLGGNGGDDWT